MKIIKLILLFFMLFAFYGCTNTTEEESKVTITFLSNGGEAIENIVVSNGEVVNLQSPTREGFKFINWKDTNGVTYPQSSAFTKDTTLVAQWEINTYKVTFVDYDDSLLKEEFVEHNKSATKPNNPTRNGYSFVGWDQNFTNIKDNLIVKAIYEESTEGLEFELIDDEYTITKYNGSNNNVIIPSMYNGLKVTTIGTEAFKLSTIVSVQIPDSILYIEEYAFMDCSFLEEVTIPTSVIEIKKSAFENNVSLAKATIGAKIIGESAFYSSNRLVDIVISDNTEVIGISAFYNCSDLETLTIPSSVTTIGNNFVSWCQKLTTIFTPVDNVDQLQSIIDSVSLIYVKALNKTVMPIN